MGQVASEFFCGVGSAGAEGCGVVIRGGEFASFAVADSADEGGEGVAVVAAFGEEGPGGGVFVDEHGGEFSGGGGVAEAAEDFGFTAGEGVGEGAAAFCFVAEDPDGSAVVGEVGSFVFDVELAGPDVLFAEAEVAADDILDEEFAAFGTGCAVEGVGFEAAEDDGAAGIDFDAAAEVAEVADFDG